MASDQAMDATDDFTGAGPTGGYHNGYDQSQAQHPYQGMDHSMSHQTFSPPPDADASARYGSQAPSLARPPSGPGETRSTAYQEQNARSATQGGDQAGKNKNSVVIKVGMVGDAQIGKTSLMVKYVEGSWDEDYIQTLGEHVGLRAR